AGASMTNPIKMGVYYVPFTGAGTPTGPNYGSCTMHSWQMQLERQLALGGMYQAGTWVLDPSKARLQSGGQYTEFLGTTWGNTLGNNRDAADYVNATQWLPFDLANPDHEKLVFVSGSVRGLDIYRFTGTMPKKEARLRVNGSAAGGTVTGKLERYAILTSTGFKNLPLAGKTVEVSSGGKSVQVSTEADGTFSAPLALPAGANAVQVIWAGDDRFRGEITNATVTV
ncbi:MAG TPA: hypothetical protein VEA19_00930, partial [Actinomycetota bacterium]|nr:hypothetical protein [Actinomycetota bacterium]